MNPADRYGIFDTGIIICRWYSDIERFPPTALPDEIDGFEYGATRDKPALKPVLAEKIDQYPLMSDVRGRTSSLFRCV